MFSSQFNYNSIELRATKDKEVRSSQASQVQCHGKILQGHHKPLVEPMRHRTRQPVYTYVASDSVASPNSDDREQFKQH